MRQEALQKPYKLTLTLIVRPRVSCNLLCWSRALHHRAALPAQGRRHYALYQVAGFLRAESESCTAPGLAQVVARAIAFTIMLQGLAIDSLAALALTGDASISTLPMTASQLGNVLARLCANRFAL